MEDNSIHSHVTDPVAVHMYTREESVEKRLLRGRVLLDSDAKTMLFAQNEPRTRFSKEVMRTDHGRLVRRWDGLYTLTFSKMDASERRVREALLSELRNAMDAIEQDVKKQNLKKAKERRKEGEK